jgi:hypothetical protein
MAWLTRFLGTGSAIGGELKSGFAIRRSGEVGLKRRHVSPREIRDLFGMLPEYIPKIGDVKQEDDTSVSALH